MANITEAPRTDDGIEALFQLTDEELNHRLSPLAAFELPDEELDRMISFLLSRRLSHAWH